MEKTNIAGSNLLGDRAYGTKEILAHIKKHGAAVVIPPKSNVKEPWAADYYLYTSLNASSRELSGFVVLLQDMINLTALLLPLYYGFYPDLVTFDVLSAFLNRTW